MGKIKRRKKKIVYLIRGYVVFENYRLEEESWEVSLLFVSDKDVFKIKELDKAMILLNEKAENFVNNKTYLGTSFKLKRVMLFKRLVFVSPLSLLDYMIDGNLAVI